MVRLLILKMGAMHDGIVMGYAQEDLLEAAAIKERVEDLDKIRAELDELRAELVSQRRLKGEQRKTFDKIGRLLDRLREKIETPY